MGRDIDIYVVMLRWLFCCIEQALFEIGQGLIIIFIYSYTYIEGLYDTNFATLHYKSRGLWDDIA